MTTLKHQQTLFQFAEMTTCPTLVEVIEEYLEDCLGGDLTDATLRTYRTNLQYWTRHLHSRGRHYVQAITKKDLRSFLAKLRLRGLSPYTRNQRYRVMHTFLEWCVKEELIEVNPIKDVSRPQLPRNRYVPRLSYEQFEQLLEAVLETWYPERNLAVVLLLGDSGLRRGEISKLDLQDLDLDEEKAKVEGKGNKEREVPLSEASIVALRKWLDVRPAVNHDAVFVSRQGKRLSGHAIQQMISRLGDKIGVKRLYPHLLRHTFAKLYIKAGGDIKTLQKILGHSKARTTADFYLDPDIDDLKEAHGKYSPTSNLHDD